ncbi:TPA: AAA family ATPase [Enterococcus faecium]|jgi:chromosome partitioning protein|uniref:ParA family protein n=1 Tax=Enterococcus faecium TaxID=1352 RepID=UPI0011575A47|nr:AAA family ATPase [Enterococcus faecium]MDY5174226.1 AAA family ATPase [Enterococcus faecium]HAR1669853.1 AAA family ATPase [Enterococcus faecium]
MANGKVISVINMKGGVGKTTLTKEIGIHLSEVKNKKVLLIDVDPQLNLTQSLFRIFGFAQSREIAEEIEMENNDQEIEDDKKSKTLTISSASIERIFSATSSSPATIESVVQNLRENLDLVPGELGIEFSLRNLNSGKLENGIFDFIRKNQLRESYDYIIIDCPPTYSSYTVAALKPSDFYLVPVKPEAYSILGLDMLLNVVDSVVEENGPYFESKPLNNLGIIFTEIPNNMPIGMDKMVKSIETSTELKKRDTYIFTTKFKQNAYLRSQINYVIDYSRSEQSKQNLQTLVDELIERMDSFG